MTQFAKLNNKLSLFRIKGTDTISLGNRKEIVSQRLVLLLIILQSIGIRSFPMQSILFSVIICLIITPSIRISIKQLLLFILLSVIFTLLSIRGLSSYTSVVYLILIQFTAFFFVRYVKNSWAEIEIDLLVVTWWLSLHGLLSYLTYKALPTIFSTVVLGELRYKVFGIFILSGWDPIRATGLCWEPGLLQYVANLSLFLGLKNSWPRRKLAISFFTVVVTYSTTGIFALIPIVLYLFLMRRRSILQWISLAATVAILASVTMTVFKENVADKLSGSNVSGLVRLRDTLVGWELLQEKPFVGHGQFDYKYLSSKSRIWELETELFSKKYLDVAGEMSGGYTNGFMGVWAGYGIFLGVFFYWCFFNNRLIQGGHKERLTFFLISIITFLSEPITNTSWFFALTISGLSIKHWVWQPQFKKIHHFFKTCTRRYQT